ncbi:Wzz/FepE/Etk N-terminal domain-containing protein [Catenovulum adriaticum]|uniref:Wzz/FepE/Etk N-terminal domain-containing protein n=1 Tax=Catenovulum adriaticum TaxID=2984846 RepID=A0ABY7AIX3_9ALTE|nr:Wzz/FepE/Etk N-terminal domain-containing protein [Catenovulum sp. TS8]WAJ69384.1 Wzz/FepE/Etk N-terminal domain-containing protein [Catenovulum sp. TS8]
MTNNLENRLQHIEDKLDHIALKSKVSNLDSDFSAPVPGDDEIDLRELWNVIWAGKFKIIAISAVFAIASVIYALSLPNIYRASITAVNEDSSNNGGLSSQLGGLAALAGVNIGGSKSSRIDQALALLESRPFLEKIIADYNFKPELLAAESWSPDEHKFIYDEDLLDPTTREWLYLEGESLEPKSWTAYKVFKSNITAEFEAKSGLLILNYDSISPEFSLKVVNILKNELNIFYQHLDMEDAKKNINYLTNKISETQITDMQAVFYKMIESQTKTLMLAEVSDEYLVKTVVPATYPEEKFGPKRGLICILITFLGGLISLVYVLIAHYRK